MTMFFNDKLKIKVSSELKQACPEFKGMAVYASVGNSVHNDELWKKIGDFIEKLKASEGIDDIKLQPVIAATREGYKKCGKDPSRYRPSAEALRRRILRGLGLYEIDTLVDIINLVSLVSGYSIGGFDADKICGDELVLGIGKHDEPYEGIGRGILNIEGMPVYRDTKGGIGTPTSDNERTKMDLDTKHILAIFNGYDGLRFSSLSGEERVNDIHDADNIANYLISLLTDYANGTEVEVCTFE